MPKFVVVAVVVDKEACIVVVVDKGMGMVRSVVVVEAVLCVVEAVHSVAGRGLLLVLFPVVVLLVVLGRMHMVLAVDMCLWFVDCRLLLSVGLPWPQMCSEKKIRTHKSAFLWKTFKT